MTQSTGSTIDLSSILGQVKGLEDEKARLMQMLEEEKNRTRQLQEHNVRMSETKRNEMLEKLNSIIQQWLNDSVKDEKVRADFQEGMKGLVEKADDNGVWQVVCNASALHKSHLETIEQIRSENEALKSRVDGDFKDERSRKRGRDAVQPDTNCWNAFAQSIGQTSRDYIPDVSKIKTEIVTLKPPGA